ncbi:copper-containing nitrite reductase [Thalassospira sp. TSL5-1]|uniref:copper-containing nitrite reductase n=1 Tax=Thalassospira sp. TSL5-1 TaxID=1544451 RepID=UPI00093A0E03|nr:copper-containing nitrite reductase [Thalassospira sp. TSL5-1]OKH86744.1 nitrite reductase [Thalassospira sp. TSL5-1]
MRNKFDIDGLKLNRRNILRGSFLAGAAAATLGVATAQAQPIAARPKVVTPRKLPITHASAQASDKPKAKPADLTGYTRVKQELVMPPFVPKHDQVAKGGPKIIEVTMEIEEKLLTVDEDTGASIWALTYNGSVPGPMIIAHEGDYIELTLRNPASNAMEHNIDFHASTGALGGGGLTHIYPGEETVLRFKAIKPGVFTYHCAPGGAMIPYHVTHGMNGAVMILPRDGLKDRDGKALRYDSVAYIGEQDFYLPRDEKGDYKTYDAAGDDYADSVDAMRTLIPTHSVFNGSVGALTGDHALKAKVGETVLMIHNQANRDTRPHLIGGHGDFVWETGSFGDAPQTGLETWFIRGGSAGAAMYTFKQPGVYAYVNHNLIEAALLGATAHFVVEGEWNNSLMEQVAAPRPIAK